MWSLELLRRGLVQVVAACLPPLGCLAAAPQEHLVSHMHIIAENLVWRDRIQKSLFFEDAQSPLDQIKRNINQKLGRFAIRSAETLPLHEIYHDTTHNYDICDISGKMCF